MSLVVRNAFGILISSDVERLVPIQGMPPEAQTNIALMNLEASNSTNMNHQPGFLLVGQLSPPGCRADQLSTARPDTLLPQTTLQKQADKPCAISR